MAFARLQQLAAKNVETVFFSEIGAIRRMA
jgi:hypothetical protein